MDFLFSVFFFISLLKTVPIPLERLTVLQMKRVILLEHVIDNRLG